MIYIILYGIGCLVVYLFSNKVMILGYKTMKEPYKDDYKSFFDTGEDNGFPEWLYKIMAIGLSWLFLLLIYTVTIILIKQKREENE